MALLFHLPSPNTPIFFMKKLLTKPMFHTALLAAAVGGALAYTGQFNQLEASSHREAPYIMDDPLADNTDLYVFRDPSTENSEMINIIANYIPFELPQGGPNFNTFGENIRYEIHIKNKPTVARFAGDATSAGDDITYRFTFTRRNEVPETFFRIRNTSGTATGPKENLKTTYNLEVSRNGGAFTNLVTDGEVAAPNVGPRSVTSAVGLGAADYQTYADSKIRTVGTGADQMRIFCGPTDDPFFTDLGAIFDLGGVRGPITATDGARDGLARKNVHAIVMQIPIKMLQKDGRTLAERTGADANNILDPNYVIGVWASASRQALRTLNATAPAEGQAFTTQTSSGDYVQVSRLGMPLTNEVVQPIGLKDKWNADSPYRQSNEFDAGAKNPELALYMANNDPAVDGAEPKPAGQTYFGQVVPGFNALRIQSKSLAGVTGLPARGFDFRNGADGLFPLKGNAVLNGTALADAAFGNVLLQDNQPRSVDILPIFHTGVPNLPPYQLATGKANFDGTQVKNPLSAGKPFVNNFLPTLGDMLRLNMAVPATPRNSADFSSEGLLAAAVLGLTDARYNANATVQNIPNMDGFPNGRRLEDDVTRIELQAVGGIVLAAIGLPYDNADDLGQVIAFTTNVERNDVAFRTTFPYVATAWSGTNAQPTATSQRGPSSLNGKPTIASLQVYPNPVAAETTFEVNASVAANLTIVITDITGKRVATVANAKNFSKGNHSIKWRPGREVAPGQYIATVYSGKTVLQSVHIQRD